jgi:hypothetical protein
VILLLPGASLPDLTRPDLPHLSVLARHSAGAWAAAWKEFDLPTPPGIRLQIPLQRDPERPFGVRADGMAIKRATSDALKSTDIVWIDPGDLERAEGYAPLCLPAKAREHRAAALRSADELLEALLRDPQIQDLWLVAPPLQKGPGLAPFFWWRRGGEPGLLRSGSTHMTGVITGADVAATLASIAGTSYTGSGSRLPAPGRPVPGRGVGSRAPGAGRQEPVEVMRQLGVLAERTDRLRSVVNYLLQWLLLLLVAAGAIALRTGRRLPRPLALGPLLLPALPLLDGARRAGEALPAAAILLLIIAGIAGACWLRGGVRRSDSTAEAQRGVRESRRWGSPFSSQRSLRLCGGSTGWICRDWAALAAATAAACAVAVLAGDIFRWSMLGNSIRLGVRFYGVGNEFMGWWIGAALLATGVPDDRRVQWAAIGWLLGVALLIGHPALGGKVGGMITALAAAGVEAWPLLRRRALMAAALGLALAALVGLAAWDASRPAGVQTHLGRLLLHVASEGPRPLFLIARGKLLTNLRLTLGLWGALLAAGVWLILEARRQAPKLEATRAVQRLLPVAAVAFLCNDSGVIAAALMLSYGMLAAG